MQLQNKSNIAMNSTNTTTLVLTTAFNVNPRWTVPTWFLHCLLLDQVDLKINATKIFNAGAITTAAKKQLLAQ